MSCTVPEISADAAFFFLYMYYGTGYIQCQLLNGVWTKSVADLPGIEYSAVTNCDLPTNGNTLTVNFNITEELKDKNISCQTLPANAVSDSILNIQELKCKCISGAGLT